MIIQRKDNMVDLKAPIHMSESQQKRFIEFMNVFANLVHIDMITSE